MTCSGWLIITQMENVRAYSETQPVIPLAYQPTMTQKEEEERKREQTINKISAVKDGKDQNKFGVKLDNKTKLSIQSTQFSLQIQIIYPKYSIFIIN
uniref:Uncharacterized protein n=1 Tax=Elaeophora elaphi TaxID=1147741 RepID=A0A0R3RNN8_9BILA